MDPRTRPTSAAEALGLADQPGESRDYLAAMRSGETWNEFCEGADMLASEFAGDDLERGEGFRNLLGYLSQALTRTLYACTPDAPAFVRGMDDIVKVGLDNPDGINSTSAQVSERFVYRLFGTAGKERYVEFVQSGAKGTLSNHYLDEFHIGPDGAFEIMLSAEPRPGNWIPLQPGVKSLLVRQIQYDWENEPLSDVRIERPGASGVPYCLRTPDPEEVGRELASLGRTLVAGANYWLDYTRAFAREGPNIFPKDQPLAMSGYSAVRAAPKGMFQLAADESLLLEFTPPKEGFWSVAVGDIWFRSIDPSHRHSSLNGFTAKVDSDGLCRVVIAHADPGVANWLDTAGHPRGHMIFRFVRTESRPEAKIQVIPHAEIAARLPPDTARVTPQERAKIIAGRARAYARRYARPMTSRWRAD